MFDMLYSTVTIFFVLNLCLMMLNFMDNQNFDILILSKIHWLEINSKLVSRVRKHGEPRNQVPEEGSELKKSAINSLNKHSIYHGFSWFSQIDLVNIEKQAGTELCQAKFKMG